MENPKNGILGILSPVICYPPIFQRMWVVFFFGWNVKLYIPLKLIDIIQAFFEEFRFVMFLWGIIPLKIKKIKNDKNACRYSRITTACQISSKLDRWCDLQLSTHPYRHGHRDRHHSKITYLGSGSTKRNISTNKSNSKMLSKTILSPYTTYMGGESK